jgi:hypothetical protein
MKISMEAGKTGRDTLVIEAGGKNHAIYSRYDPERDGMRFFNARHKHGTELYVFIGLGLGYHIAPFVRNAAVRRVVVLEPDESLVAVVREIESVGTLLSDEKVEFYAGSDVPEFLETLKGRYDYLFFEGFKVLTHPRLLQVYGGEHEVLESRIQQGFSLLLGDALTIGSFARVWINNLFRNLSEPGSVGLVSELYGCFRGTAVVAGAGPSLDLLFEEIRMVRQRIFLIAADAALKPLLRHGIRPDLMVSVDPQSAVHHHLTGVPEDEMRSIPVVMNPLCNPELTMNFSSRYLYFTLHPSTELFRPMISDMDELIFSSGAVSSLAAHLAARMGFETICLAGMDFSFPGCRAYARHTFFYDYCNLYGTRFRTPGNMESEMLRSRGSRILDENRQEMEALIAGPLRESGAELLNLSPLGADIEGAPRAGSIPATGQSTIPVKPNPRAIDPASTLDLCSTELQASLSSTLILRNRLYRNAGSMDDARGQAERWMVKKCSRTQSRFKV